MRISGSFGPTVVLTSSGKRTINIAGGSGSGDVYREVSSSKEDPFEEVRRAIAEHDGPEDVREDLRRVVLKVQEEIAQGDQANVGLVDILLRGLRSSAPRVLLPLARAIAGRTTCPAMREVALQAVAT